MFSFIAKIKFFNISLFLSCMVLNTAHAQISVYTPNASGGPTDHFIKTIILPAIKNVTGVEVSSYTATLDIEKTIEDVKHNQNSIAILTDTNVIRFEKLKNVKITDHLNINTVLAITPVVLFKFNQSKIDWNTLINKDVKIGYIEGFASERCAIQMRTEYGGKMQLVKLKNEAEVLTQMIEKNVDGYCTASLLNITAQIQVGHFTPVAASHKISFAPYNHLQPYFPDNKIINARGFLAIFSSLKSVEGDSMALKLSNHFNQDKKSISDFNKIYLQPVVDKK